MNYRIRLVSLFFLALVNAACSLPRQSNPRTEAGFAPVNGSTLYYEFRGHGEPVVLVQGANLSHRMWDQQFEALSRDFRVIRYDVRGFGRSGLADTDPYQAHQDLRALLDHLHIQQAQLVGLSLGGRIAVDFALEYPTRLKSLVLAGPGLSGWQWDPAGGEWYRPIAEAVEARDSVRAVEGWLKSPYMAPAMENPALAPRIRALALENARMWVHENREEPLTPPAVGRLSQIRVPTLLILGSRDVPDIHRIVDRLAQEIPGAERVIFEDSGHLVNLEAAGRFTATVRSFLGRH